MIVYMKILTIVGWSKSGKTHIIVDLIKYFKSKNKRVITLKNIGKEYSLQPEGKDTELFLNWGSDIVFLNSKDQLFTMVKKPLPEHNLLDELKRCAHFSRGDIFLCEGKASIKSPLIEVFNPGINKSLKYKTSELSAVICDSPLNISLPVFLKSEISKISAFIEEHGYEI